jgi:hypothetical protein
MVRGIAATGMLIEIFPDHLKNPTALVVFGGIAGGELVIGSARQAKLQMQREEEIHRTSKEHE